MYFVKQKKRRMIFDAKHNCLKISKVSSKRQVGTVLACQV